MHVLWRIGDARSKDSFWDGNGGLYVASRWVPMGYPVIYTSASPALSQLEFLVHFSRRGDPEAMDLLIGSAIMDDGVSVQRVESAKLPSNWMEPLAPPLALRDLGQTWLRERRSCALQVPSALSPEGYNYLINPEHSDIRQIDFQAPTSFSFDTRLMGRLTESS